MAQHAAAPPGNQPPMLSHGNAAAGRTSPLRHAMYAGRDRRKGSSAQAVSGAGLHRDQGVIAANKQQHGGASSDPDGLENFSALPEGMAWWQCSVSVKGLRVQGPAV